MIKIGIGNILLGAVCVMFGAVMWHEYHLTAGVLPVGLGCWILWHSITDDDTPLPGA